MDKPIILNMTGICFELFSLKVTLFYIKSTYNSKMKNNFGNLKTIGSWALMRSRESPLRGLRGPVSDNENMNCPYITLHMNM